MPFSKSRDHVFFTPGDMDRRGFFPSTEWTVVLRIYLKTLLEKKSELLLTFRCYSEGNQCPEAGGSFSKPLGLFIEETDLNQVLLGLPPKTWSCDFGLSESWKKEGGSPAPTCLSKLTGCCLPGKPSQHPPHRPPQTFLSWCGFFQLILVSRQMAAVALAKRPSCNREWTWARMAGRPGRGWRDLEDTGARRPRSTLAWVLWPGNHDGPSWRLNEGLHCRDGALPAALKAYLQLAGHECQD